MEKASVCKKYIYKYAYIILEKSKLSNESKFELCGTKTRKNLRRKSNEALVDKLTTKTFKYGDGSIVVWGYFSWNGVGNLVEIFGIMTTNSSLMS